MLCLTHPHSFSAGLLYFTSVDDKDTELEAHITAHSGRRVFFEGQVPACYVSHYSVIFHRHCMSHVLRLPLTWNRAFQCVRIQDRRFTYVANVLMLCSYQWDVILGTRPRSQATRNQVTSGRIRAWEPRFWNCYIFGPYIGNSLVNSMAKLSTFFFPITVLLHASEQADQVPSNCELRISSKYLTLI